MDQQLFHTFRDLIHRESGIFLNHEKVSLLQARIFKRLRALSLQSPEQYLEMLTRDRTGVELVHLLDVVSTNVTYFYREGKHFEILRDLFLQMEKEERRSQLRVWCAASSSGEEPYTISMVAADALQKKWSRFKLLATDISTAMLQKAAQRSYAENQLRELPGGYRQKYMKRFAEENELAYRVIDEIAAPVILRRLNLSSFPFPLQGPIDIIFCRNVMIYFDEHLRQQIVREFERLLAPGGYLFLSHSENLLGVSHSLKSVGVSVFRKGPC